MGRNVILAGLLLVAGVFVLASVEGVGRHVVPGAWADEGQPRAKRRAARRGELEASRSSPEEIARYFQLHGGNIDPSLNKQTQAGPFDSGFFFNSGIGPNGGDSPYMN